MDVDSSERHNNYRSSGSNTTSVAVASRNKVVKYIQRPRSQCYEKPHYIAAAFCLILGFYLIGCWLWLWQKIRSDENIVGWIKFLAGIAAIILGFSLVHLSLNLADFGVYPCAVSSPERSDSQPVVMPLSQCAHGGLVQILGPSGVFAWHS
jgi:hypothetical protein